MEPLDPSILSDVADKAPDFPPLLSVGVLSVGEHNYQRRWEQRQTWFGLAQKQSNPLSLVYARFVVRCGARMYSSAPYSPSDALLGENATHGDLVCTDIAEDAGKLKGPSLLVLAWYDHALRVQPRTRFIATVDDDAYVHLAPNGILDILRELPSYAATGRTYVGAMHGWTFNATQYRFLRFGWSGTGDAAEGPFPFATGAFMCVSRGLATQIYSATREEAKLVTALPPRHPVFYQVHAPLTSLTTHFTHHSPLPSLPSFSLPPHQDPFIGQAIFRLVVPTDPTTPVDIYDLDPFSLDSDGFKVAAGEREGSARLGTCCGFVGLCGGCSAVTADRSLSLPLHSHRHSDLAQPPQGRMQGTVYRRILSR